MVQPEEGCWHQWSSCQSSDIANQAAPSLHGFPKGLGLSQPLSHLLLVIRRVRQHRGHVEHDLVVLVGGVERVCACGIRCIQTVGDTKRTGGVWVTLTGPVVLACTYFSQATSLCPGNEVQGPHPW